MEHRTRLHLLIAIALFALAAQARVFMTQPQALASAFPAGAKVTRQVFYLTPAQLAAARKESGVEFDDRMIVRYAAPNGFAYFDTHRVRTLAETVMVVVTPDGKVDRIEILSFDEPPASRSPYTSSVETWTRLMEEVVTVCENTPTSVSARPNRSAPGMSAASR